MTTYKNVQFYNINSLLSNIFIILKCSIELRFCYFRRDLGLSEKAKCVAWNWYFRDYCVQKYCQFTTFIPKVEPKSKHIWSWCCTKLFLKLQSNYNVILKRRVNLLIIDRQTYLGPVQRGGVQEDLCGGLRLAALSMKRDQPGFRVQSGDNRLIRGQLERLHSDRSMCDHPK